MWVPLKTLFAFPCTFENILVDFCRYWILHWAYAHCSACARKTFQHLTMRKPRFLQSFAIL